MPALTGDTVAVVTFDSAVIDRRYKVCATSANPNGIQIHQPRVGIRAGRRGAPTLGNRRHNFTNAEGVASHSTANHTNHAKIKTKFPFAYLACFAVRLCVEDEGWQTLGAEARQYFLCANLIWKLGCSHLWA